MQLDQLLRTIGKLRRSNVDPITPPNKTLSVYYYSRATNTSTPAVITLVGLEPEYIDVLIFLL